MKCSMIVLGYAFVACRLDLTWADLEFGFEHGWIDVTVVERFAVVRSEASLLSVIRSGWTQNVLPELRLLAREDRGGDPARKWLYLVLAWLYEHRDRIAEPLARVAEVYADFGDPEEIAHLVHWMPMDGPDRGSGEANEERLFERWGEHLRREREAWRPPTGE